MRQQISENGGYKVFVDISEINQDRYAVRFLSMWNGSGRRPVNTEDDLQQKFIMFLTAAELKAFKDLL